MTEFIAIKKMDGEVETFEIVDKFQNSTNLEEIKKLVENAKDRLFVSWSTVDAVDKDGERIPIEDAIVQQDILMRRGAPMIDEHENAVVGKTLAYKIMKNPQTETLGVLQLNQVFCDNEQDDKVWKEIKNRERNGMSVGGFNAGGVKYEQSADGSPAKVFEKFRQYETSIVHNPANPYATMESFSAVAKSSKSNDKVSENKVNVKKQEKECSNIGETIMAEENTLKMAVDKLAKGEALTQDQVALITKMYEEGKEPKDDKEEEVDKSVAAVEEKPEAENSGTQPEDPSSGDVNEVDVAKSIQDAVSKEVAKLTKAFNEKIEAMQKATKVEKSMTPVAVTPKAETKVNKMEKIEKTSSFYGTNAYDLAIGKVRKSWSQLHKEESEAVKAYEGE